MSRPLFFQQRFLPMWLGQSFGALADNMNRQVLLIGVPAGVVALSGFEKNPSAIPIIGMLFPIGMLIGCLFGGQFAEKFETSKMFRRTKLIEVILMFIAAMGLVLNQGWFVMFALFAMGLQSAFFNPVRQSAMPKYLGADELIRGNGLCNAGLYACIVLGFGIGGFLILAEGNGRTIAALVLFAFSLIGFIAILFAPKAPPTNPDHVIDWTGFDTIKMIGTTLRDDAVVRPLIGLALFYFISMIVTVLLPLFAQQTLNASISSVTIFMLLFAVGAGTGALISASLSRGRSGLGFATIGVGLAALVTAGVFVAAQMVVMPTDPDLLMTTNNGRVVMTMPALFSQPAGIIIGALLCLSSIFLGVYLAPLQAAIQRRAPSERRARVLAVGNMLFAIAAILGSVAVLFITKSALTPNDAFLGIAILLAFIALYMVRRRGQVPEGLYDEALTNQSKVDTPTATIAAINEGAKKPAASLK